MVEAVWRQLRHRWLYLHTLDSFAGLQRLVAEYFTDHNSFIPRAELDGRTPDEAYFERDLDLGDQLRAAHAEARARRVATNRAVSCARCHPRDDHIQPSASASGVP